MKKTYAYILLTTLIPLSTACMELERKKTDVLNIQMQSSIALQSNSPLLQFNTLNALLQPQPFQRPVIQKKYTDRYLNYIPVYVPNNTNEVELTPIYRPIFITENKRSETEYLDCITNTKIAISQEEQKPNVYTNNFIQVNTNDLINELHNAARTYQCYCDQDNPFLKKHQKLTHLITLMRQAKKNNIHEDFMSRYAYEKSCRYQYYKAFVPLLFGCLKKYIATTNSTNETIPFNGIFFDTDTVKTLKLTCQPVTKEDIDKIPQTYPAYSALINAFTEKSVLTGFDELLNCLYINTATLFSDCKQYNVDDFDDFYFYAVQLFDEIYRKEAVYNIINLVGCIKNKENISCKEMCHKILNFHAKQTLKTWWNYGTYIDTVYQKNKIALLYTLVEEYNCARKHKTTPTEKQCAAYNQKNRINIALPDNFDATLFDRKVYAFTAFGKLKDGIGTISRASSEDLQQMVELKMKQLPTKS
jgi:hypothetical protein